jgi:hypothetical protein
MTTVAAKLGNRQLEFVLKAGLTKETGIKPVKNFKRNFFKTFSSKAPNLNNLKECSTVKIST